MKLNHDIVNKMKDKAEKLFSKGKFEKALGIYEDVRPFGKIDPRIFIRIGDISRKLDKTSHAIEAYKAAVETFVKLGFAIKAIAVCKMITHLDPSQDGIQNQLARLMTQSGHDMGEATVGTKMAMSTTSEEATPQTPQQAPPVAAMAETPPAPQIEAAAEAATEAIEEKEAAPQTEDLSSFIPDAAESAPTPVPAPASAPEDVSSFIPDAPETIEQGSPAPVAPAPAHEEPQPAPEEPPQEASGKRNRAFPHTPLFSDFKRAELFDVVKKVRYIEVPGGETIFNENDTGDSIFIVVDGELSIEGSAKDGSQVPIATLTDGDFFGEFGFFSASKRKTTVKAKTAVSLLELTKADINEIIRAHPRVSKVLFEFYKERVVDRYMALSKAFRPMSPVDRKAVLKRITLKSYKENEIITQEGEVGETMYLIKSGRVAVGISDEHGIETPVTELTDGDFFGEIALATNKPRTATVSALTDVETVVFTRSTIKDILGKYPKIKEILLGVIKERVEDSERFKKHDPFV